MNEQLSPDPQEPATEPVTPGPVTGLPAAVAAGGPASQPLPAQARWARIGLLGIGAAALIAVAALAFGTTAAPSGTLAAGANGPTSIESSGVDDLNGGPGMPGIRGGFGAIGGITIKAISGSSISLETADGWTRTVTVDDGTTYTRAGADIKLGDLAVGDAIGFRQTREDDGSYTIDAISVILPHVGGEVTAVSGSKVTVKLRDDTTTTVTIGSDAKVVVNGDAAAAGDIKVGMLLMAEGTKNADGSLDAARVHAVDAKGFWRDAFGGRGFRHGPGFGPGFGDGKGHGNGGNPDASAAPDATSGSAT